MRLACHFHYQKSSTFTKPNIDSITTLIETIRIVKKRRKNGNAWIAARSVWNSWTVFDYNVGFFFLQSIRLDPATESKLWRKKYEKKIVKRKMGTRNCTENGWPIYCNVVHAMLKGKTGYKYINIYTLHSAYIIYVYVMYIHIDYDIWLVACRTHFDTNFCNAIRTNTKIKITNALTLILVVLLCLIDVKT